MRNKALKIQERQGPDAKIRILILEDKPDDAELIQYELKEAGLVFASRIVDTEESYREALREFSPDLILSDYDLPRYDGIQALSHAREFHPDIPFILVTGAVTEDRAIEVLTSGARDYVLKKNLNRLVPAVERALEEAEEHKARRRAEEELRRAHSDLERRVTERTRELEAEIRERERVEKKLKRALEDAEQSKEFYRVMGEALPYGVWMCGPDGGARYVSQSFLDLLEMTQEEQRQFGWTRRMPPEDVGPMMERWMHSVRTGEPWDDIHRIYGPDRKLHYVLTRGRPVRDKKGKITAWVGINLDIDKRIEMERALQESEERLRALLAASSEVLYRMSPDWSEMRQLHSRGFLANTEKPNTGWLQEYIHPDDQPHVTAVIHEAIRTKSIFEMEHRVRRADGSLGWTFSRAVPLMDADGEIVEWFGAASDITDRKQTEEALRESEEKYRLIFESSLSGILITRPDGSILSANPAAQHILGMTEEEIIQAGRGGISDPSDPRLGPALEERERTGRFSGELNYKRKDGTIFPVEVSSVRIKSQKGQIFTSVIFRDITWRKNAEKVLKESSQHFRELADSMPQLVWTGTPDGQVDYFNVRYAEFPEIRRGPSGFWEWTAAVHPEDLPATLGVWKRAIQTQADNQVEHRLKGQDGTYRWYLSRGVAIRNEKGQLIKWIGTTTDIHDIKEAETTLKERTRLLEEANKELESFSYSVSHDLRAPLRAIDGFSRMLLGKEQKLDQEANRKLKIIRENAVKMDRLINDLLYFSRSGRAPFFRTKIDMDGLVKEIWDEQLSANPERKMELKKGKLPIAVGDEALIRQVVSNLLANAVKFTRRKRKPVIEIGSQSSTSETVYYVRDNGAGFDMKYSDKLFGVFQRLHPESEYEGTGVGLAIVQRIIHRHGGRVWAEGKPGKGATFCFSLPTAGSSKSAI